ncbi:MAG: hypothetical protein J6Q54_01240 [Oscillospiraceae bacterium]|nr:hypothetical protein [Oscillospiraceae bacterium]
MEYNLQFAGLNLVLHAPMEITISDSLRPFLCQANEKTDCTIELQLSRSLPEFSADGTWHGPEYYDRDQGALRIFHCKTPNTAPFAVTRLLEDGNITIHILPEYLSYFSGTGGIFNRIGLETLLLQHNALLLHASLIQYKGKALAFSGPSGVGKSTQAAIWQEYLGAEILNGDRAVLRQSDGVWRAYGSPYAGTSGIYKNADAPLEAIIILRQAPENRLMPLPAGEAFRLLYPELSIRHWQRSFVEQATDLCLQLLGQTPVYLLECRPEESAALLVKKGLRL